LKAGEGWSGRIVGRASSRCRAANVGRRQAGTAQQLDKL
jgi:hypothetical protein